MPHLRYNDSPSLCVDSDFVPLHIPFESDVLTMPPSDALPTLFELNTDVGKFRRVFFRGLVCANKFLLFDAGEGKH